MKRGAKTAPTTNGMIDTGTFSGGLARPAVGKCQNFLQIGWREEKNTNGLIFYMVFSSRPQAKARHSIFPHDFCQLLPGGGWIL
jgi:hypothetical protein